MRTIITHNHTRMANVHSPKSFFFTSLAQQSSKFTFWPKSLIDQAQTRQTLNPEAFLPKAGHERQWMLPWSSLFLLPVLKTCMSLAWPTLVIIRRREKGAEGTNPRVWFVSTATLTNPIIVYRPKLCWQQPPTRSSSSLFTMSGGLARCTSPQHWSPGSIRRSWAHE